MDMNINEWKLILWMKMYTYYGFVLMAATI